MTLLVDRMTGMIQKYLRDNLFTLLGVNFPHLNAMGKKFGTRTPLVFAKTQLYKCKNLEPNAFYEGVKGLGLQNEPVE